MILLSLSTWAPFCCDIVLETSEMSVMLQGGVNRVKTGRDLSYRLYWHELLLLWEKNVVWFNLRWVQSCWVTTFTSSGFWLSCSTDPIMKVFDAVSVLRKAKYFYLMCFIAFVYLFFRFACAYLGTLLVASTTQTEFTVCQQIFESFISIRPNCDSIRTWH